MLSHPLIAAAMLLACSCLSHTTPPRVARVFFLYLLKEAPQPLDANLDQWLICVELLGLPTHLHVEGNGPTV
jgi:hypothetical protein